MNRLTLARHFVGAALVLLLVMVPEDGAPYWMAYVAGVLVVSIGTGAIFGLAALFFTEKLAGRKGAFAVWVLWALTIVLLSGEWAATIRGIGSLPLVALLAWWWRSRRAARRLPPRSS